MSQTKEMEDTTNIKEIIETVDSSKIQTRRTSRSNRSSSPCVEEEEVGVSSPTADNRITRSLSVESNGYETNDSRKKRKKLKTNHNEQCLSQKDENERETRTSIQKSTKEAREAKKAQRDIIIRERLDELDKLEKSVKDGSHSEYHKLLEDIEAKRANMVNVAKMRRSFAEGNVTNFFNAQKYAAYSQYHWDKLALRRSMIQYVQHKINMLEQEYYSNHIPSSLDDDHLTEWVPPDRPSMISSLTLGLNEEDVENDIEWAKQNSTEDQHQTTYPQRHYQSPRYRDATTPPPPPPPPTKGVSSPPPLNMLASLVDHQHPKEEQSSNKSFTLPPLNHWRYDQRPSLPT